MYATDGTEYTEALTGCQTTLEVQGLVSHWKFDEGTGSISYDSVGNVQGSLLGSPTWASEAECVFGACIRFNGTSSYIDFGNKAGTFLSDPSLSGKMSASLWVNIDPGVIGNRYYLSSGAQTSSRGFYLYSLGGGLKNGTSSWGIQNQLDKERWINMVIVWNGQYLDYYENGVFIARSNASAFSITDAYTSLYVGRPNNTSNYYHKGLIDDVRIYDRDLTIAEVEHIYSLGATTLANKNGACGSAHNSGSLVAPTIGLCSSGSPSDVIGVGPWTWSCTGSSGYVNCTTALLGSESNPASSCASIMKNGQSQGSGYYWLDMDMYGSSPKFQAYCDMVTDGGGWTRLDGNMVTSSIGFGANGLLRSTNKYGECNSPGTNFLLSNFKIDYNNYRLYLTRETTIHQCSRVTNNNGAYYKDSNNNWVSNEVCTWGDSLWARACCTPTLYSELKKNWLITGSYASSLKYTSECSSSADNGYFTVYVYVK